MAITAMLNTSGMRKEARYGGENVSKVGNSVGRERKQKEAESQRWLTDFIFGVRKRKQREEEAEGTRK